MLESEWPSGSAWLWRVYFVLDFRSPILLALAAADAASNEGAAFRRSRSGTVDRDEEERADPDLGLDPADTEGLAWQDRNRAKV